MKKKAIKETLNELISVIKYSFLKKECILQDLLFILMSFFLSSLSYVKQTKHLFTLFLNAFLKNYPYPTAHACYQLSDNSITVLYPEKEDQD